MIFIHPWTGLNQPLACAFDGDLVSFEIMNTDQPGGRKADVPLYFLILGLTPALGVSHSFIHSVLMAGFFLVLLLLQGPLLSLLGYRLPDKARFTVLFFFNLILVTLLDLLVGMLLPKIYPGFGIYLKLLAINPLILKVLSEQAQGWDLGESILYGIKTSLGFLFVAGVLSLSREILGAGRITYGLEGEIFLVPYWSGVSFKVLMVSGGGALILAGLLKAFQNWGYHRGVLWLRQDEPQGHFPKSAPKTTITPEPKKEKKEIYTPPPPPTPLIDVPQKELPVAPPVKIEPPVVVESFAEIETPLSESPPEIETPTGPLPWGESLDEVLSKLWGDKSFEKKRILVIGCGTGEEVYRIAMVLADAKGTHPRFSFRIRGVDAFSTRIESAKEGIYRETQLDGLSLDQKQRYLLQNKEEGKRLLRMGQDIRQYVEFLVSEYLGPGYFFQKPSEVILVNQEMEFLTEEERQRFLNLCGEGLAAQGALYLPEGWPRRLIPGNLKRSGDRVYRKEAGE